MSVRPFGDVTLLAIPPRLTDSGLILVTFWFYGSLWVLWFLFCLSVVAECRGRDFDQPPERNRAIAMFCNFLVVFIRIL